MIFSITREEIELPVKIVDKNLNLTQPTFQVSISFLPTIESDPKSPEVVGAGDGAKRISPVVFNHCSREVPDKDIAR